MTTDGEALSNITTPTKPVTAGPRLRELTYRYQPKHAPDGQPIRLGAVIRDPKTSAAALTTLLHDEARRGVRDFVSDDEASRRLLARSRSRFVGFRDRDAA